MKLLSVRGVTVTLYVVVGGHCSLAGSGTAVHFLKPFVCPGSHSMQINVPLFNNPAYPEY